jgi:putative FmdB family regulatory protein
MTLPSPVPTQTRERNTEKGGVVRSIGDPRQLIPDAHGWRGTMPVYEFVCRACKKKFALVKPIAKYDPKKVTCPQCKSKKVDRRWSGVFVKTSKKS